MSNKDKPWFDEQCRHALGLKQDAHLRSTHDRSRVNPLPCGGVYHPNQTLNAEFYITGESNTGLCLAILQ